MKFALNFFKMLLKTLQIWPFLWLCLFVLFLFQKDELKKILSTKEKQQEESLRTIEALKAKLKYYEVC